MTTRKRILFVDGEQAVRDSIKRLIRPFALEWDAIFVPGAQAALEQLAQCPADVVVTGLDLGDMDGPQFLKTLTDRHPQVVRIVYAPPADQPLVMQCAASAHQFITRPCEAEILRDSVNRAFDMESSVRRERINRLVERMDNIPSLPNLYLQLVEKLQDPECSLDEIGAIIARDISMTARILKLVNSAYFGLRRRVSSAQEAVNYVGVDTVKALVLSISAFAQFEKTELKGVNLEALWNHSLLTAGCAKTIAISEGVNARMIDEAFVAGMLHDVGKLALGANFPSAYAAVAEAVADAPASLLTAESAEFGADHAEIGGHLLSLWGLPNPVVDAVLWHHNPMGCPETGFSPLACVHAANIWAHEGDAGEWLGIADEYYEKLRLAHRVPDWHRLIVDANSSRATA